MKKASLLFTLFLYSSIAASNCYSTHYIYLIHGIAGSNSTFGKMKETLMNYLPPCSKILMFEYDTGNKKKTIWNFAKTFKDKSKLHLIGENDTVSMIMHSQGGLIGLAFLDMIKNSKTFDQIDSFITLSTPFHGAHIARWGEFFQFKNGSYSPFGRKELQGMKYGSLNYYKLLSAQKNLLPKVRALSIGGYSIRHHEILGEDDNVVPVYSSRANSIFLDARYEYKNNELNCGSSYLNSIDYVLVPAVHFRLARHGIAKIPAKCINNKDCGHPSIIPIIDHLNGLSMKNYIDDDSKEPSRYRVTIYIESNSEPKVRILKYPENNVSFR